MARKLKVYGVNSFRDGKQVRVIFAGTSERQLAEALGETLYYIRLFAGRTGNDAEIALAISKPFTLFTRPLTSWDSPYSEWHPEEERKQRARE